MMFVSFLVFQPMVKLWADKLKIVVLLLAGLWLLVGCHKTPQRHYATIAGETMGTTYHIRYAEPEHLSPESIKRTVDEKLLQINKSMSTYDPTSLISQFNAAPVGKVMPIDAHFFAVMQDAKQVYEASNHAFDPSVMPLVELWGFGHELTVERLQHPPSQLQIEQAQALLGFDSIELRQKPNQLLKTKPIQLDFSAIAKGYAVDQIAQVLTNQYHINNFMVEIGGEVVTRGKNPTAQPWQIAIDEPALTPPRNQRNEQPTTNRRIIHLLQAHNMNIATSGNYRNTLLLDGVRYSHTIDPRTGMPVQDSVPSVTVLAKTTGLADAWATALTAVSYKEAVLLAETHDIAALFVIKTDKGWQTVASPAMQTWQNVQNK